MALPIKNLPAGCIKMTFQANIEGYTGTTVVLAPRVVSKLLAYCTQVYRNDPVLGVVKGFPGLTELFEYTLDKHLIQPAEALYPDELPESVKALEVKLAEAKAAALPKFL